MVRASREKNVFFIKADSMLIAVGENSMKAFDLLFKMHYVFNLEYASELINFYDFIESCIVQLHPHEHVVMLLTLP